MSKSIEELGYSNSDEKQRLRVGRAAFGVAVAGAAVALIASGCADLGVPANSLSSNKTLHGIPFDPTPVLDCQVNKDGPRKVIIDGGRVPNTAWHAEIK